MRVTSFLLPGGQHLEVAIWCKYDYTLILKSNSVCGASLKGVCVIVRLVLFAPPTRSDQSNGRIPTQNAIFDMHMRICVSRLIDWVRALNFERA